MGGRVSALTRYAHSLLEGGMGGKSEGSRF